MISRAKIRGEKLDEDCKRAYTTSHEYGPDDDRVFCYGLFDYSNDEICKAHVYNSTPLEK